MTTFTRTLLATLLLGGIALTPLANAVDAKKRNECAASIAALKEKIASLKGDQSKILEALEEAIKQDRACAPWLAGATVEATNADDDFIGEISFVALSTGDESMKSVIAGTIRNAATGKGGYANGGAGVVGGNQGWGKGGDMLGPDDAVRIDGNGISLIDFSQLPHDMNDSLTQGVYAKLGDALLGGQLIGFGPLSGSVARIFGAIAPVAPELPPGVRPEPPGGGGDRPRPPKPPPPVSPTNTTPTPDPEPDPDDGDPTDCTDIFF
ncbi:MAG: hypothetical protein AAGD22_09640 [Verrucomicrobiota bacterium]